MLYEDSNEHRNESEGYQPKINEVAQNFLLELEEERSRLTDKFPLCALLIDEAFDRVYATGRIPGREFYADVLKEKPMKITQKIFVPVKQYPKFNFIGKLLGPKGNSLKRLHQETKCKISIKGRNSMRDKTKEEELLKSDDPRYSHLNKDLYIEVSTVAPPAEGYSRIGYALSEIRKYLVPDKNDEVSHEQLRETMEIDPKAPRARYTDPELFRTSFDKPEGIKGYSKYKSLLNRTAIAEREEFGEYHRERSQGLLSKRSTNMHSYEYMKEPSSSPGYKRTTIPSYADYKHLREASIKNPSHPYGIARKFK